MKYGPLSLVGKGGISQLLVYLFDGHRAAEYSYFGGAYLRGCAAALVGAYLFCPTSCARLSERGKYCPTGVLS